MLIASPNIVKERAQMPLADKPGLNAPSPPCVRLNHQATAAGESSSGGPFYATPRLGRIATKLLSATSASSLQEQRVTTYHNAIIARISTKRTKCVLEGRQTLQNWPY